MLDDELPPWFENSVGFVEEELAVLITPIVVDSLTGSHYIDGAIFSWELLCQPLFQCQLLRELGAFEFVGTLSEHALV